MKEAGHKIPNVVRFHLHEMHKIGKSIEARVTLVVPGAGWRRKMRSYY